jgi:hypothetical protein
LTLTLHTIVVRIFAKLPSSDPALITSPKKNGIFCGTFFSAITFKNNRFPGTFVFAPEIYSGTELTKYKYWYKNASDTYKCKAIKVLIWNDRAMDIYAGGYGF